MVSSPLSTVISRPSLSIPGISARITYPSSVDSTSTEGIRYWTWRGASPPRRTGSFWCFGIMFIRFSVFRVRQGPGTLALTKSPGLTQGNFDLFRFGFLSLGKDDFKDAIFVTGLNFLGINGGRKGQASLKFSKEALCAEPLLAFFFLRLAFTRNGQ